MNPKSHSLSVVLAGGGTAGHVSPLLAIANALRKARRYAVVGIVVLVAVITPSGDPISMLALSGPMVLFYEVSILIGRLIQRRRRAAAPA